MGMRAGGLVVIVLCPACTLYWDTNQHDASVDTASSVDSPAVKCAVVLRYDWNDGTTQGWAASTAVSNAQGALVFTNQANGSLQAFGPQVQTVLAETDVISFRVHIDEYSVVTAPSQLTRSGFGFDSPFPGDGALQFSLDTSGLAFGESRVFSFPVSAGTYFGSLTRAAFLSHAKFASLIFADAGYNSNVSAGTLDDFTVVQAAGCVP